MLAHILVPTDGSASALMAARLSETLVSPGGDLLLLNVQPDATAPAAVFDSAVALLSGTVGNMRARQAIALDQEGTRRLVATREMLVGRVPVRTEERRGSPAAVILDELDRPEYDSVVLGSHGHNALARALIGSVSDAVLRVAGKPVLIARSATVGSILVAVDGSPAGDRACDAAAELAGRLQVPVTLLHVSEVRWEAPPEARQAEAANVRAQAEAFLAKRVPSLSADRVVAFGEPSRNILAEARQRHVELVILGRLGRTAHRRVTLGSVAARVALHAEASVLIVP